MLCSIGEHDGQVPQKDGIKRHLRIPSLHHASPAFSRPSTRPWTIADWTLASLCDEDVDSTPRVPGHSVTPRASAASASLRSGRLQQRRGAGYYERKEDQCDDVDSCAPQADLLDCEQLSRDEVDHHADPYDGYSKP